MCTTRGKRAFSNWLIFVYSYTWLVKTRATHMPLIGTCAGSTHKRQGSFLEFLHITFPCTVCLALGCNTTASLHMTVYALESFSTTSCRSGLYSLILGGVYCPKVFKLLFLADLMQPCSTLPSWERFWDKETWVIRPRQSFRLHSSKGDSCRDDARKSKFGFKYTPK